ncbi:hypothetical protein [Ruminococcus sp. HUN007]|uniref:hypothetical protein n=1 Tax=Ruminococcus sp. HUN007 TaxID=1514668 RepID=UPI0005D2AF93|nr:hypothetical protein [Ruminococcus sp. HUN007]
MRTSKEMADAVLKARDAYEEKKRKRIVLIKNTAGIAAVACSFFIMAGSLIYFNVNKPENPDKSTLEVPEVTETTLVSEDEPAETPEGNEAVTEKKDRVTEESSNVTEAVSGALSTEPVTDVSETVKPESTERSGAKESPKPSADSGKKQDQAVTERQHVHETAKAPVTEKEKVPESTRAAVTRAEVTRAAVTEKQVPRETAVAVLAPVEKVTSRAVEKAEEDAVAENVKPTNSSPKPMITPKSSAAPVPVAERVSPQPVSPQERPVDIPDEVAAESPKPVAKPESSSAPASMKPISPSPHGAEAEILIPSEAKVEETESSSNVPDSQAAFDDVINFTVVNNTDCYLYFKDNDQILVILCQNDEDVQKINDMIAEKRYDPAKFECRINDIVIDLPAQKTDDMELQRKLISRFMTQNNIYGYAKIEETDGEEKISVKLNDSSSENAAKIRYFLSMYSISFNSVKIDSI